MKNALIHRISNYKITALNGSNKKRKVTVVTGTSAEYRILKPFLLEIKKIKNFNYI